MPSPIPSPNEVRLARMWAGLTRSSLAERLGCTLSTIKKIEDGSVHHPDLAQRALEICSEAGGGRLPALWVVVHVFRCRYGVRWPADNPELLPAWCHILSFVNARRGKISEAELEAELEAFEGGIQHPERRAHGTV